MIEHFADKNAQLIWDGKLVKKLPRDIQETALEVMSFLNNVKSLNEFAFFPNLKPHKLVGDRKNTWSLKVKDGWRVTFLWDEATGTATHVRLEDYH